MKPISARLDIRLYVNCPHCDDLLDLLNEDDTGGVDHNEEGYILQQACPDGYWCDSHDKFELHGVICGTCGEVFNVNTIEW